MKTIKIYFILSLMVAATFSQAQQAVQIPKQLPANLQLKDEVQKYQITTDQYNTDIFANFYSKVRVRGEYTRGLSDGKVKWNNVSVAMSMDKEADFAGGVPVAYMENFTYKPGEHMMTEEKFADFTEHSSYAKNLIWDMLAIEGFAWRHFDELKLNTTFSADYFNGKIDLAGQGFFENKDIRLTWIGISERNGERCALIEYRTLNNSLEVTAEGIDMKGRSHYWGTIWVSLEDKQIEHAVLYEDVIVEMLLPGQSQKQVINATREIEFKKLL